MTKNDKETNAWIGRDYLQGFKDGIEFAIKLSRKYKNVQKEV